MSLLIIYCPYQFDILFLEAKLQFYSIPQSKTMPFLKNIKAEINRNFSFQFSTPTQDISSSQAALKYFNAQASYTLIPGIQNSQIYDAEKLLSQIMPYTTNILLDICLPYVQTNKKKNAVRHFGRYIVCNKRLLAIRIKPSDNWPRSRTQKTQISSFMEKCYGQMGIKDYPRQILIGQFLIATRNFKLAPLFESQCLFLTENTSKNILTDYYSLGCQIFSIVNDVTEQKRKNLKDHINILKNYRKQSTAIIYCGMHLALQLNEVYQTKSFARQGSQNSKKIQVQKLDEINAEKIVFDLNTTKINRKLNLYNDLNLLYQDIQTLNCTQLRLKLCFQKTQKYGQNLFQKSMELEEQSQNSKKQSLLSLYLWHLYVNVNKRNPFTFPCPMTDKDQVLVNKILGLSQLTNVSKASLINLIKLDSKGKLNKLNEFQNFKFIVLDKILRETSPLYTYFPLRQRISLLGIQKDKNNLQEIDKKIINCTGCITEEFFKILQNLESNSSQVEAISSQDDKFVQKFIKKKNGNSLQQFYFEAAKYYPRAKLTPQFIQNLFEALQIKARKQFLGTSFQKFVLKNNFQNVKHIFAEAEQKFFFSGLTSNNLKAQEDQIQEQTQNQDEGFRNFIKKIKYHCNIQKKNYYSCHICSSLFNKKQKASYGRFCLGCTNFVCHSCFDFKTGQTAQSDQAFQQCLICQNKCTCQKCAKRHNRDGVFKSQIFQDKLANNPKGMATYQFQMNNEHQGYKMQQESVSLNKIFVKYQPSGQKLATDRNKSKILQQQIRQTIKPCFRCDLHNRAGRNIEFTCTKCNSSKCFSCQKAQNHNRNWVLRGSIFCNDCHKQSSEINLLNRIIQEKQTKIVGLEHQMSQFLRQKFMINTFGSQSTMHYPIAEQNYSLGMQPEYNQTTQKGGATPIFDRPASRQPNQSPLRINHHHSPSQNGSIASFGGQKHKPNAQKQQKPRKNSSNASGSGSPPSNRSNSPKKDVLPKKTEQKKRKNSSDSGQESLASFNKKHDNGKQNSSKGSVASKRSQNSRNGKRNKSRNSSVQSGQYQGSQSSDKNKPGKNSNWTKNYHQNTQQSSNNARGRGRGWGQDRGQNHKGDRTNNRERGEGNNFQKRNNNRGQFDSKKKQFDSKRGQFDNKRGQNRQQRGGNRGGNRGNNRGGNRGDNRPERNFNRQERSGDCSERGGFKSNNWKNNNENKDSRYDNRNGFNDKVNYQNNKSFKSNDWPQREDKRKQDQASKNGFLLVNPERKVNNEQDDMDY